jgi:hypothetical protein
VCFWSWPRATFVTAFAGRFRAVVRSESALALVRRLFKSNIRRENVRSYPRALERVATSHREVANRSRELMELRTRGPARSARSSWAESVSTIIQTVSWSTIPPIRPGSTMSPRSCRRRAASGVHPTPAVGTIRNPLRLRGKPLVGDLFERRRQNQIIRGSRLRRKTTASGQFEHAEGQCPTLGNGFQTPILLSWSPAPIHSRLARSAQNHGLWSFRTRRRRVPYARQNVGVSHPGVSHP